MKMHEKELLEHMKRFKRIVPRQDFVYTLKQELLSLPMLTKIPAATPRSWGAFRLAVSFGAAILVIAVWVGLYGELRHTENLAGFNNKEILSELASSGDINIYINEIEYYDEAHKTIDVALNEISKNQKNKY